MIQVYHNPRCGKSRECLAFLDNSNAEYEIIRYLENPPTEKELRSILIKLKINPIELVRIKEEAWESFKDKLLSDDEVISALVKFPILIERPIVIIGNQAVIARPADYVLKII